MTARSVKEVIAGGKLKTFIDRRLIKALSHPLREHVLAVLNERVASTSEIGREIDLDVPAFYHHVELLEELGFLERVESRRRRGAVEHFFRARATMLVDDEAWARVPATVRSDIAGGHIWAILSDLVAALRAGAFGASPAAHTTWLPAVFDRRGWGECLALMNETLAKMVAIQRRSGERMAATGEPGLSATISLMGFVTAPPSTQAGVR